jgi:hypothetical protein
MEELQWYLGEIDWVGHRGHHLTGSFCPLFKESTNGRSWERELDEASRYELFPNQGRVSWWSPHSEVKRGEIFHFTMEDQPTYEPENPKHDRFRVREVRKAAQYLDFSAASLEESRLLLTTEGISLPDETLREYSIRLCRNLWSEPLSFVQLSDSRLWIIDPKKSHDPLRWHEWSCEERFLLDLGKRKVLGANAKLQGKTKLLDWCPDATLLDRVMRRLRGLDRAFSESLHLSASAVTKLAEIHATIAAKGNLELENARLERVRLLLERVKGHADVARVVADLLETEPIRNGLAEKRNQILEDERTKAQKQAHEEVETERKHVEKLKQEASTLKAAIDGLIAQQDTLLHGFELTLGARLKEVFSSPEKFLAELSLLKAALDTLAPERTSAVARVESERPKQTDESASLPADRLISSAEQLNRCLEETFERSGVSPALVRPLHASLLSGAFPVFSGPLAYEACAAYARCVTAGSLFWFPVSPTLVEPAQLFSDGGSSPEATGLLQFLLRAQTSEHMQLVLLDGINKAPVDSYLMPILACYRDAWQAPAGRMLPLRSHSSSFPWPRNVLLAAIHSEGMVSISPPATFWNHSTLILGSLIGGAEAKTERIEHPDRALSNALKSPEQAVTVSQWASWRASCAAQELEPCVKLWSKFASEFALRPESRDLCLRYFAAIRTLHPDVAQGIGDTIAHCLFPQLAHEQEKALERLSGIPLPYKDIALALALTAEVLG